MNRVPPLSLFLVACVEEFHQYSIVELIRLGLLLGEEFQQPPYFLLQLLPELVSDHPAARRNLKMISMKR